MRRERERGDKGKGEEIEKRKRKKKKEQPVLTVNCARKGRFSVGDAITRTLREGI